MNVESDECDFLFWRLLVETKALGIGVDNENAAALTAGDAKVAEKIMTDKQEIGWVRAHGEEQRVRARDPVFRVLAGQHQSVLSYFLRVLGVLGGERFSLFSRRYYGRGANLFWGTLTLSFRVETACVTTPL